MADSAASNLPELSVSELAGAVKRTMETNFDRVRVRGELGRVLIARSGHLYVDLKDDSACISLVMWKTGVAKLAFKPEEGLEVVAEGKLTTYPSRSQYQLIADRMEPAGIGALLAQLEKLKAKLAGEGLFAAERKKPIPFLPQTIGVVTSPTGAVIRDILHRLEERFPRRVLLWPVLVQGEQAAGQVAKAIAGFNALQGEMRPDVLIVARGGGSLEDLWAFNEEIVVRAAAESLIPLVSAIGHETDTTLIDFAADLRAPTPTGAAEKVTPVRVDLLAQQTELARRLAHAQTRLLDGRRSELRALARVLPTPDDILGARRQSLDACASNLRKDMRDLLARRQRRLADLSAVLARHAPHAELERTRRRLDRSADSLARLGAIIAPARADALAQIRRRLERAMENRMARGRDQISRRRETLATWHGRLAPAFARLVAARRERLASLEKLRASLGYENVLARGFAIVRDERDAPLRNAASVAPGQKLAIQFADGRAHATADGEAAPKKPARPAKPPSGQGSLF